jgi:hypothetical protein
MACELRMAVGGLGTVAPLLTPLWRPPALLPRLAYLMLCRSIQLLALLARSDAAKDLEILVLRHQLTVLRREISRPRFETADRALLAAVSRALPRAFWSCFLVKPETLLRWHRRLIARAWTYSHHQTGRPPLDKDLQQLIIRLARENPRLGYQRIKGELQRLGVQVSATTIRDRPPRWPLGCPAGPQPAADVRGSRTAAAVSDPRPGCQVHPRRRRRLPVGRLRSPHHAGADAQRQRPCGALDPYRPRRVPGLAAAHWTQACGASAASLRRP